MFIYVNKDDLRAIEMYRLFNEKGYYVSDDIKDVKYADIIYLGLKGIDRKNRLTCFDQTYVLDDEMFKEIKKEALVVTLIKNNYLEELSLSYGFSYFYLADHPLFLKFNSLLCVEGIISYIIRKRHKSLINSKVIVFGNGHIGHLLIDIFFKLGIECSVVARNKKNIDPHIDYYDLKEIDLSIFDVVINTIPSPVISHKMIKTLRNDTLLLDVASFPYGLDHHYALSLSKNVHILSAIPAKYAYIDAAIMMNEIIEGEYNEK